MANTFPSSLWNLCCIPIFREQIVEHTECGLQVHVDDVLRTSFGLRQADVLHQFERESDVVDHLVGVLWRQVEVIERNEEPAQQAHQQTEVDAVLEVGAQASNFKVEFVQVFVDERDQRLFHDSKLIRSTIEQSVEGVAFASHSDVVVLRGELLLVFPEKTNGLLKGKWMLHSSMLTGRSRGCRFSGR